MVDEEVKITEERHSLFQTALQTITGEVTNLLGRPDDLVPIVLRMHLLSEYQLERLIIARLSRGDRVIDKARLGYHQKLTLVDSFNLVSDSVIQVLSKLNTLRNECSHEREVVISASHVEKLGRSLGKEFSDMKRKYLDDLKGLLLAVFIRANVALVMEIHKLER